MSQTTLTSNLIPVTSKWSFEDLNAKTVQFRFPAQGGIVRGVGRFLVAKIPGGKLEIDVTTDVPGARPDERTYSRHPLPQSAVDCIEPHPDPKAAAFRLEV